VTHRRGREKTQREPLEKVGVVRVGQVSEEGVGSSLTLRGNLALGNRQKLRLASRIRSMAGEKES
jgi:hypothetical protein